ncbi:PREDICTED: uncharacterized protein LOC103080210 [Lipotes vexillifer]|uniref:Uncharacterized protein LOC103080210 n=1 Tax=Lipotes vexillifer TaxID=118797 RepID=A0A340X4E2_LIPVE|nr:PREDICTED: uncharacterized protein LOC103080210 [Lipotes vexillifer]
MQQVQFWEVSAHVRGRELRHLAADHLRTMRRDGWSCSEDTDPLGLWTQGGLGLVRKGASESTMDREVTRTMDGHPSDGWAQRAEEGWCNSAAAASTGPARPCGCRQLRPPQELQQVGLCARPAASTAREPSGSDGAQGDPAGSSPVLATSPDLGTQGRAQDPEIQAKAPSPVKLPLAPLGIPGGGALWGQDQRAPPPQELPQYWSPHSSKPPPKPSPAHGLFRSGLAFWPPAPDTTCGSKGLPLCPCSVTRGPGGSPADWRARPGDRRLHSNSSIPSLGPSSAGHPRTLPRNHQSVSGTCVGGSEMMDPCPEGSSPQGVAEGATLQHVHPERSPQVSRQVGKELLGNTEPAHGSGTLGLSPAPRRPRTPDTP